jgi:hypothetical protein
VAFYASSTSETLSGDTEVYARIGKWGHGLLTEAFFPVCVFHTKPRQEYGVWEFAKPYRVYPGERLSANIEYRFFGGEERSDPTRDMTVPAIQFNGVRTVDQRPVLLYDNFNAQITTSQGIRLAAEKLQCPADSPVDIYSCVAQPTTTVNVNSNPATAAERLMIYSPDGRQWWDDMSWPFLFDPPGFIMDLNKPEWVINPGESFFCEFITTEATCDAYISLRGHVEVSR